MLLRKELNNKLKRERKRIKFKSREEIYVPVPYYHISENKYTKGLGRLCQRRGTIGAVLVNRGMTWLCSKFLTADLENVVESDMTAGKGSFSCMLSGPSQNIGALGNIDEAADNILENGAPQRLELGEEGKNTFSKFYLFVFVEIFST